MPTLNKALHYLTTTMLFYNSPIQHTNTQFAFGKSLNMGIEMIMVKKGQTVCVCLYIRCVCICRGVGDTNFD